MNKIFNWKSFTRLKPFDKSLSQNDASKVLTRLDLFTYGIAATVGSGVYAVVGEVARESGPSVILSTMITGFMSLTTALCYLEFASMVPTSGSSYIYAYSTMGEFLGWFLGWNLTLEYSFAAAAIAREWGKMFAGLINNEDFRSVMIGSGDDFFVINIIAGFIVVLVSLLTLAGAKGAAVFNNVITGLNILAILFLIIAGLTKFDPVNLHPFFPQGVSGVSTGAMRMFFSYIGFDTICTLSAEAKNPSKDLPFAVFGTIIVATVFYVGASLALVGMVPYSTIDKASPLIRAFEVRGMHGVGTSVAICALTTMAATLFACISGQPRIFKAMAADGLMPKIFAKVDKKGTAIYSVLLTAVLTATLAVFVNDDYIASLVSFGSILGFSMICAGLILLRFQSHPSKLARNMCWGALGLYIIGCTVFSALLYTFMYNACVVIAVLFVVLPMIYLCYLFHIHSSIVGVKEDLNRLYCPLVPFIPCVALLVNINLMVSKVVADFDDESAKLNVLVQFTVWAGLAIIVYLGYGISHSELGLEEKKLNANVELDTVAKTTVIVDEEQQQE